MSKRKANPIDAEVGRRIKLHRLSVGLSQTELGDSIGVTFQQVQKYERGQTRVGASRLTQIAKKLNIPIGEFFESVEAAKKGNSSAQTALQLLAQPLAIKLLQLFSDIPDRELRQSIVQLVENIKLKCQAGIADGQKQKVLHKASTPRGR
jgi:transcriptional regulator with XRE-family HTH domain